MQSVFGDEGRNGRPCAHHGCGEAGIFRAPASRERLEDYIWLCLDHVRTYNQAWDYFKGMGPEEIERQRQRDAVWQRPTWRIGTGPKGPWREGVRDDFGFFRAGECTEKRRPRTEEEKALNELGLQPPACFAEIKARYKELAKRLHPDANGGDRDAEERLKTVNRAYATLKALHA